MFLMRFRMHVFLTRSSCDCRLQGFGLLQGNGP